MSDFKEYAIVMIGSAASAGALSIIEEKSADIWKKYSARYISEAELRLSGSKYRPKDIHFKNCLIPCGKDGVFGALWRLGEEMKTGLKVRLFDIPIDRAAIELCDYMDINPYESDSTGAYILATDTPNKVMEELRSSNISAKLIGYTTSDNSRVVEGPTERYLTK